MIEVENSLIAKAIGYHITLYPFILYVGTPSEQVRKHEFVHVAQIQKDGVVGFYYNYLKSYLINRLSGMDAKSAYFSIPYEIEAYRKEKE